MYRYLKVKGEVIAFRDNEALNLAKYVLCFPENVKAEKQRFSIFNHRNAVITDVVKRDVRSYAIGWLPSKDAYSVFRVCQLMKEVA